MNDGCKSDVLMYFVKWEKEVSVSGKTQHNDLMYKL